MDKEVVELLEAWLGGKNTHIHMNSNGMPKAKRILLTKLSKLAHICGIVKLQEAIIQIFAHSLFERRDNLTASDITDLWDCTLPSTPSRIITVDAVRLRLEAVSQTTLAAAIDRNLYKEEIRDLAKELAQHIDENLGVKALPPRKTLENHRVEKHAIVPALFSTGLYVVSDHCEAYMCEESEHHQKFLDQRESMDRKVRKKASS